MSDLPIRQLKEMSLNVKKPHRLPDADVVAKMDNPLCGDEVLIELKMVDGKVAAIGYNVDACILCEAATNLLVTSIIGTNDNSLQARYDHLQSLLTGQSQCDDQQFAVFKGAVNYSARHSCILLPFQTALKALQASK